MKFYIETYGCQMNIADSEMVAAILTEAGYEHISNISDAEIIIFNTCSVRQHAEDRVLGRITNEIKRKKSNPNLKIGVIGCMAQRIGEILVENNSSIDFAVGVDQYIKLPEILSSFDAVAIVQVNHQQIYDYIQPIHSKGYCGFVTIMRGCDNFCSYCIVPLVRGRERSRPVKSIIQDIDNAVGKGIKDITLLGQNVNSYKWDVTNFPKLLKIVNNNTDIDRIRFITSHPKDLSDGLIEIMATTSKVCEHIHLPVQSGDNQILNRMNRKYTIEHYFNLVNKLRKAIPGISITTDIIAGFPGETDHQFENTLEMMKTIGFDYAFCFKYSDRTGTAASGYHDQIPEEIRLHRLQRMIAIQRHQTKLKFENQIGKVTEVLVEGLSKQGGNQLSGKTRDFKICAFNGKSELMGQLVNVEIVSATAGTLIGRQI